MKREGNNEIDLLLRRMSRHDGNAAHNGKLEEQHLDADELSAYAQNALPPAARTRYIEHLAECASCRRLATELSLSLGATTAAQDATVAAPSGWKVFLASLFSPMVLRYAVPALSVIVVMVVGFVVLRQRQFTSRSLVARVETKQQQERVGSANTQEAPVNGREVGGLVPVSPEAKSASSANPAEPAKPVTKPAEPKPEPSTVATDSVGGVAQPLTSADQSVAKLQPGVATSTSPAAPTAAKAAPAETEADKKAQEEKKPAAATETVEVRNESAANSNPTSYQNANGNTNENATQSKAKTTTSGLYEMRGLSAARRGQETKREEGAKTGAAAAPASAAKDEQKEDARDDAETRSVAGRQFQSAWHLGRYGV